MDALPMPGATTSDAHHELVFEDQVLLILVGLPGSGKTTFSEALLKHHHISVNSGQPGTSLSPARGQVGERRWIRASQDDAPSRRRQEVEAMVRRGLEDGCNVVVDRVGFDRTQRSHFVAIARARPIPPRICCLVMSASPMTLETRLLAREYHPTIKDPETAIRVLGEMTRQMSPPRPGDGEGFDRIAEIREDEQPTSGVWLLEDVQRVLRKVAQGGGDEGQACRIVPVEAEGLALGEVEEVEEVEEDEDKGTRTRDSIIRRIGEIKAIRPPRFRIRTRINQVLAIGRTHTPRRSTLTTLSTSHNHTDRTTPVKHLCSLISPAHLTLTFRHEMPSAARDHLPTRQVTIQLDATETGHGHGNGRSVDRNRGVTQIQLAANTMHTVS